MQYNLNLGVVDTIASAKMELERIAPSDPVEKASLTVATEYLNEDASALKIRQNHIKLVDCSRFS